MNNANARNQSMINENESFKSKTKAFDSIVRSLLSASNDDIARSSKEKALTIY